MKPEIIQQTIDLWRSESNQALGKPTVKARSDGAQAILEAGAFSWRADLPAALGGTEGN